MGSQHICPPAASSIHGVKSSTISTIRHYKCLVLALRVFRAVTYICHTVGVSASALFSRDQHYIQDQGPQYQNQLLGSQNQPKQGGMVNYQKSILSFALLHQHHPYTETTYHERKCYPTRKNSHELSHHFLRFAYFTIVLVHNIISEPRSFTGIGRQSELQSWTILGWLSACNHF